MVAEEPTVWTFEELKPRTEDLLDDAQTAIERGHVRRVLHKIARLEDIRQRYDSIGAVQAETDRINHDLGQIAIREPRPAGATASEFDGVGVLRPVVSRRADAPRYALVDDRGDVLTFITPGPGMNLQPYVGGRVGMSGTRGYMPQLRKPHLMVKRVTSLADAPLRR